MNKREGKTRRGAQRKGWKLKGRKSNKIQSIEIKVTKQVQ